MPKRLRGFRTMRYINPRYLPMLQYGANVADKFNPLSVVDRRYAQTTNGMPNAT